MVRLNKASTGLCIIHTGLYAYIAATGYYMLYNSMRFIMTSNQEILENHNEIFIPALPNAMLFQCFVYMMEIVLAFVFGITALRDWEKRDYIEHHLPYVIFTGSLALFYPCLALYWWPSLMVIMIIQLNESLQCVLSMITDEMVLRRLNFIRGLYVLPIVIPMIIFEVFESTFVWYVPDAESQWVARSVSIGVYAAAFYHMKVVLPGALRSILIAN